MKKLNILLSILIVCFVTSCSDYLDIVPDNVATLDNAFTDKVSAERFLATIYSYMPGIGNPQTDPAILASDEYGVVENSWDLGTFHYYGNRIKLGEQNSNSPLMNYWEGLNDGRGLYIALRDCNIFLENIGKVPDLDEEGRARWIAEVKFFKAFYQFYLIRMYGPIPLAKDNLPIGSSVTDVKVYRDTFDDGIKYITQLCDEAMPDLPLNITDIANEMGRITRPAAAMLKAEAMVLAASPLFNGNPDLKMLVDNRGTKLCSETEDPTKWTLAATACKEAIDVCTEAGIKLYTFSNNSYVLSDTTKLGLTIRGTATERWNQELIWGNAVATTSTLQSKTIPFFSTADRQAGGGVDPAIYADFKMAELFYSNNGVPIEEDKYYNYLGRYQTVKVGNDHYYYIKEGLTTAVLNTYREPRFYADLGFDCGYWYGNGRTKDVGKGSSTETPWIMAMKQGQMNGKQGDIRYTQSGYFIKKTSNFESATSSTGTLTLSRTTYPIMRLGDLYLLYAEALNESLSAPNSEVYEYVDKIRNRAGLKGVVESWAAYSTLPEKPATKEGMREIIHQERMIELCFESNRFWDLRRWKKSSTYFNKEVKGWNVDQTTTEDYYNVIVYKQLEFTTKQYFWPISETELRRNSNLIQNPYWNN